MTLTLIDHPSPLGDLRAALDDGRLCGLAFADCWERVDRALTRRFAAVPRAPASGAAPLRARLQDYFAGDLAALDAIEIDLGGTAFQRAVWSALRRVPAGRTATYGEIAGAIRVPSAGRAVGAASGANPISIIIPCHRAIGAGGRLCGYAGGLERKRWLLAHERTHAARGAERLI